MNPLQIYQQKYLILSQYQNTPFSLTLMFHHDDSFADPSLSGAQSSARRYVQMGTGNSFMSNSHYDEFSFKLNQSRQALQKSQASYQSQNNTFSLRENLQLMEKKQIIELFLDQIKSAPQNKTFFQYQNSQRPSLKTKHERHNEHQTVPNYKKQYEQLVRDFEEYISNTRQAQDHFIRTINELKKQNQDLQRSNNRSKSQNQTSTRGLHYKNNNSQFLEHDKNPIVNKLELTIEKYLEINNELIGKVEKLQRAKQQDSNQLNNLKQTLQKLQLQCDNLDNQNLQLQSQNLNFRNIIEQLKQYIKQKQQLENSAKNDQHSFSIITQKLKQLKSHKPSDSIIQSSQIQRNSILNESSFAILNTKPNCSENDQTFNFNPHAYHSNQLSDIQIQNKELKMANMKLEGLLEKKSQKIRKLLQEMESLSEEKMMMKQQILELKTANKENVKVSQLKEGHSINETLGGIGGVKMASSSIYSLKNSQSTCLQTSKGPKQQETMRQGLKESKSAIRQAYKNCFKKSSQGINSGIEQSGQKGQQIRKEAYHFPRVSQFSSKKSTEVQLGVSEFRNEVKMECFGVIRKRSNIQS